MSFSFAPPFPPTPVCSQGKAPPSAPNAAPARRAEWELDAADYIARMCRILAPVLAEFTDALEEAAGARAAVHLFPRRFPALHKLPQLPHAHAPLLQPADLLGEEQLLAKRCGALSRTVPTPNNNTAFSH